MLSDLSARRDVEPRLRPAARAVAVVAQLFGGAVDLAPYARACRARGVLLVDDDAQGFTGPARLPTLAALALARRLARGSATAIRWTKYALNNWLRLAGPIFDTSTALEFLGFTGPDAAEGLASLREKRPPRFSAS